MKELHNHIFSNTTCISKETMLNFINKQLSKDELHKVETHMLDCELCSDAYEGMALAENASMLFAIDSQIDQRVNVGIAKAPIMRNLMLAASVLVIVFGTYFTFSFFDKAVNNNNHLAINEVEEVEQQVVTKEFNDEVVTKNKQETIGSEDKAMDRFKEEPPLPVVAAVEELLEDEEVLVGKERVLAEFDVEEDEVMVVVTTPDMNVVATGNVAKDFKESIAEPKKYGYVASTSDKTREVLSKKDAKNKARSKSNKKLESKCLTDSPSFTDTEPLIDNLRSNKSKKILIMENYKVVNYLEEYQNEYDEKKEQSVESSSVSAGFENKADRDFAENTEEEIIVEITYKETLEKAIKLYGREKYSRAITQLELILDAHPDEVNGLFYEGMSYYNLGQFKTAEDKFNLVLKNKETEFNPEANWYKALCLIELKETGKAKTLLKQIVIKNGFYKTRADEKLKNI